MCGPGSYHGGGGGAMMRGGGGLGGGGMVAAMRAAAGESTASRFTLITCATHTRRIESAVHAEGRCTVCG